ncbi:MAG: NAD-dependent epimerase/dehydratase family protein [Solirubrobacteraceae bacterium]
MSTEAPAQLGASRILITGGSGFIGRQFVRALSAAGAHVRVVDLQPHPNPAVDLIQGDIAEPDVIAAALDGGADAIVHLAAVTSVLRSIEHPELTYRTNVAGTHRLLEGARIAGVKTLVFASTNAVTGPTDAPAITEGAVLRPLTPYGATKAAGEMLMSAYTASYGVRCTCLRLTNVYGPGMQAKDSIVARLMRAIRLGTTFEIYGDGRQVRDYVHVSDVVAAAQHALRDERWHGPVVIGAGKSLSVLEVVDQVRRVTGAEVPVKHGPAKPGEMPAVIVDNARARAAGWTARLGFAEGVAGVWDEWKLVDVAGAVPIPGGAGMRGSDHHAGALS